jgi:putative hydrolase of the HAD superfamily
VPGLHLARFRLNSSVVVFLKLERTVQEQKPMAPFDVILFDVGGVLLTDGWDHRERKAAVERFKLDVHELETRHGEVEPAWERGEIDLNKYLDEAVFYEPRNFSRAEFIDFMLAQSQLLPDGAMGILQKLASSNHCMIGALNNEARETNEFRFARFNLRRYLKVALTSCYVGLLKPHPAMYRRALDIFGCPPQRVLFIDDREENVAGGAAAGMQAIRFTGELALSKELERLGVL